MSLTEDKTTLEHFNHYLREFLTQLLVVSPGAKSNFELHYGDLMHDQKNKNDVYVKSFMKKVSPLSQLIKDKDDRLFSLNVSLIEGVDMNLLWKDSKLSENSRKSIWKYLTLLYVVGGNVIVKPNKLEKMIKDFETYGDQGASTDVQSEALQQMLNSLKEKNQLGEDEEDKSKGFDIGSLLGSMGGAGGIGNLLGSMGGAGGLNLENLMNTLGAGKDGEQNFLSSLIEDVKGEFEGMEMPENPTDFSSIMKLFSNPATQAKMQNIMGKLATKFQDGAKTGNFNPEQMMASLGITREQMMQQAEQMGLNQSQMNNLRTSTRDQAARERLQKKLEQKRQAKQ
jgi:hypothetical protein